MFECFDSFLIRTPYFSFNSLKDIPFDVMIRKPDFQEAIYIASPVLYAELKKVFEEKEMSLKERNKIESALYRYICRMSTRCTPFGLFAGISVGRINDKTNIVLGDKKQCSRFDMQFLCTLSEKLSILPDIKQNIKYYPNTSIYKIGKSCRYIEYRNTNSGRKYQVISVERSKYLDVVLEIARKGLTINDILSYLIENNIERGEALEYIEGLIDSQLLVNELSPSITGDDYFSKIINVLKSINIHKDLIDTFNDIQKMFHQLDSNYENNTYQKRILIYQGIIQKIRKINIPFEESRLFQVDITKTVQELTLGKDLVETLKSAMIFLNRIRTSTKYDTLSQFREAFYNRYEDREIPLMEALDPEKGIGYSIKNSTDNSFPLLNDFCIPNQLDPIMNYNANGFMSLLLKKYIEASKRNSHEIIFYDDELKEINQDWKDLPPTLYSMFNILRADTEKPLINLHGFYGTSGAKIITRFAHMDININEMVKDVISKENKFYPNAILAEIVHLPESRIGNVLTRPHIRNYEIPYLAQSCLPENRIINVSDIFVSINNGRINLQSKKLKKEIIPRLTNAHNYSDNASLPVYKFLSDVQHQGAVGNLFFDWGYLKNELDFFPRITYMNIILSLAIWNIKIKDIKWLFNLSNDSLITEIRKWREEKEMPQKMVLSDYDNELFIDWEEIRSINALFSIVKNKDTIKLKEFIYDEENLIAKDTIGGSYMNECIVAFFKKLNQ